MKQFAVIFGIVVLAFAFFSASVSVAAEPVVAALALEKEYNQYLIESLDDPNLGIRFSAAKLLGQRRVYEAKGQLVKMMKNDKEYQNRIAAGLALMEIGDEKVMKEIKKQAKKDKCKTVNHVLAGVAVKMNANNLLATK